jgi:hypothetical protein
MCLAAHFPPRPVSSIDFFSSMAHRLSREGGLIAESELRERWRCQGRLSHELDDWLRLSRLRAISWSSQRWLPAFQFQPDGCTPREDVAVVADELDGAMDASEILAWFICTNESLDDETPLARLCTDLPTVLEAARLDRFICST